MGRLPAIFALLLLATIAANALTALTPVAAAERPAGCHQHGNQAPSPHPADFQCCQAGHRAAVVKITYSDHPVVLGVADTSLDDLAVVPTTTSLNTPILSSSGPPGPLALRI